MGSTCEAALPVSLRLSARLAVPLIRISLNDFDVVVACFFSCLSGRIMASKIGAFHL